VITIKRFKTIIFLNILFLNFIISSTSFSLSPEYQKELRIGCYVNSKQYLGPERAKEYCTCTIEMLSKKFNNKQID
tara:strand:+ start:192 stop:419 length:228 start_codon:yes stop_codon:yes gene_type:complete